MRIRFSENDLILWDELADIPADDVRSAISLVFEYLAGLVLAQNAFWSSVVRMLDGQESEGDAMAGWRAVSYEQWHPLTPEQAKWVNRIVDEQDRDPGMASATLAREAGRFRACHLFDGTIDFAAFEKTRHYELAYRGHAFHPRFSGGWRRYRYDAGLGSERSQRDRSVHV